MPAKPIPGFEGYEVAPNGDILNLRRQKIIKPSRTRNGAAKVTLYDGPTAYTRALARLVAEAHVWNDYDPEVFNTPIHLDNNPMNNKAENLAWRPLWFARKYYTQYWNTNYRHATTKVRDIKTGEEYYLMEAAQKFGLLCYDIIVSTLRGERVFPTNQIFEDVSRTW